MVEPVVDPGIAPHHAAAVAVHAYGYVPGYEHGFGQSALLERTTGRLIGRAGLHPWPVWGELELGYALARDRWGRGLAREACEVWLGLAWAHLTHDHLIAVIQPGNAASITLAERLGFSFDRADVTPGDIEIAIYRCDRTRPSDPVRAKSAE